MKPPLTTTHRSIRRHLVVGCSLVFLLGGVIGGWSATTQLSGAVITHGMLVVNSSVKNIQHPVGGVVGEIFVREGQRVKAGDVLLKLDPTQARANVQILSKQLNELLARQARGQAEQIALDHIQFPAELMSTSGDPDVERTIKGEERLFEIRRAARDGQKAQLKERVAQLQQEIGGLEQQIKSKDSQLDLIAQELVGVQELLKKKLVQFTRVTALQREQARLQGERGQLVAGIGEAKGRISEAELGMLQVDNDMRSEVGRDLSDIRARLAETIERKVAAEDQLRRVELRSPQDGTVHQLAVHTIGGVIRPGDTIMEVVPLDDELIVETKIATQDVNDVQLGQAAALRFSGLNQRTTPEIEGEVSLVSADVTQDQRTGAAFYTARIAVNKAQFARMENVRLVPGMPVETFIKTHDRTALSYLLQPLSDQIRRAFREK